MATVDDDALRPQFSVIQWFVDGSYEKVYEFIPLAPALDGAVRLAKTLGGQLGTTTRIIITDGGDCIVFEWQHGQGIIFPPKDPSI